MPQFSITTVADAGLARTYDVVCSPGSYQNVIPRHYPSVRVLSVRGNTSVAEVHVVLGGRELVMMARHVATPPGRHETLVIGGDAKGSHIAHDLEEMGVVVVEEEEGADAGGAAFDGSNPAAGGRAMRTKITTTVNLKTGRLGVLSRLGSRDGLVRESFERIMADLARAARDAS